MNQIQTKGLRTEKQRDRIIVEHQGKDLVFLPTLDGKLFGPDTYANVKQDIEKDNLRAPTMAEQASLVYAAWQNKNEEYSKEIITTLQQRWLWGFTGILYVPIAREGLEQGVYFEDNIGIRNGVLYIDRSELVRKLQANDKSVRFVPFDYETGEMTSLKLTKNEFVKKLAGDEGAEKLAEFADKNRLKPTLFDIHIGIKKEETRVGALGGDWFFEDGTFYIDGGRCYSVGCAFGVEKAGEASELKK